MVFNSPIFLYVFLPLFIAAYATLPWKNAVLLCASLVFYAWGEPLFIGLMLAVTWIDHVFGRLVAGESPHRFRYLCLAVAINIGVLVMFKYLGFIVENVNPLVTAAGFAPLPVPRLHLPLGISFYVFQAVTYVVDVYRRHATPARSFADVLLYISLFPQLVAGPIVRYEEVAARIISRRTDWSRIVSGVELFTVGLAKKVLIADTLSGPADRIFSLPAAQLGCAAAWFGATCFALQIFFDFSGYSDMAIGIGRAVGFDFPQNFRQPYRSTSIQQFWQRWHMTLSRWFRDYVYIPLGGNRHGALRTYRNLFVVFLLTGFWHGASWNFMVWGLLHGLFLVVERMGLAGLLGRIWQPVAHAYVLAVALVGWVFFRTETIPTAIAYLRAMGGMSDVVSADMLGLLATPFVVCMLCAGVVIAAWPEKPAAAAESSGDAAVAASVWSDSLRYGGLTLTTLACLALITSYSHKAFIYFRF